MTPMRVLPPLRTTSSQSPMNLISQAGKRTAYRWIGKLARRRPDFYTKRMSIGSYFWLSAIPDGGMLGAVPYRPCEEGAEAAAMLPLSVAGLLRRCIRGPNGVMWGIPDGQGWGRNEGV